MWSSGSTHKNVHLRPNHHIKNTQFELLLQSLKGLMSLQLLLSTNVYHIYDMYDYKLAHNLKENVKNLLKQNGYNQIFPILNDSTRCEEVFSHFECTSVKCFLLQEDTSAASFLDELRLPPRLLCPRCHLDFHADLSLLSSASLTSVILLTRPSLSN